MEDINKDIKELEESIKEAYRCYDYDLDYNPLSKGIAEIIEHLIKAYKELEEKNEICKEELEKIDKVLNLEAGRAAPYRYEIIESLQRGITQLKKIIDNSIPVSLVEEKIEEIQKEYEETLKTANFKEIEKMNKINFRGITLEGQRSILRELLEKGAEE